MLEDDEALRSYWLETGFFTINSIFIENLNELDSYLFTINDYLKAEEQRQIEKLNEDTKHLSDSVRSELFADNFPYEWEQVFGVHLRRSFIVTLMSMAEDHLTTFCSCVESLIDAPISNKDMKGSIIERAKKFLEAIGKFKKPKDHEWKLLIDIYKLRNALVHNGGRIEGVNDEKRLVKFIKDRPEISISSYGKVDINTEFCEFALKKVRDFFDQLHKEQEKVRCNLLVELKKVSPP
jgi:hypothetical protein